MHETRPLFGRNFLKFLGNDNRSVSEFIRLNFCPDSPFQLLNIMGPSCIKSYMALSKLNKNSVIFRETRDNQNYIKKLKT